MLDIARVSVKGQVTIPIEIRKKLGLKDGDKVIFMEKNGDFVLLNANRLAFAEFQRDMAGEAERAGLHSEQDVVDLVKKVRGDMWEVQHAGNV
ncbi:MAG: AbrB/MazE/SpoVT family DNA-binding domain-containing protein [Oscillospiraceae bacterium]|jgi:AbrB family looped-hinge helix DNA binding protein|nr:AbrB/MazE/SpoVT family DNA-binding domain-containing protein [Oscillospiraceae bacterium]